MSNESLNKPPIWFLIIGVLALIWNLMGVGAYIAQAYMTDEALAALTESERVMYENLPTWYTAAFALAVFGGAIGCIGLVIRKKWAYMVLLVAGLAALAQMSFITFSLKMANAMTPMIIVVAIFLIWLAKHASKKGWIS